MAKPFSRKGLHRLECDACPAYVYATVACLESRGLPRCSCGGEFQPERLELAIMLGMDDAPVVMALDERTAVKLKAQFPAFVRASRNGRDASSLNDMSARAFDEIRAEQREQSRKRRLAALRPAPEPIPF
jgi:hypothetical protein